MTKLAATIIAAITLAASINAATPAHAQSPQPPTICTHMIGGARYRGFVTMPCPHTITVRTNPHLS